MCSHSSMICPENAGPTAGRNLRLIAIAACLIFAIFGSGECGAQPVAGSSEGTLTSPPAAFFDLVRERDRDAARAFYKKHLLAQGIPVVAAEVVDDRALQRTR